jgi:hypothetical protein
MRDELFDQGLLPKSGVNIGQAPNDGFFHAESTVLLKAAADNGGTLEGRRIEVQTDRPMCTTSCPLILPTLGVRLGNPRVTFTDRNGKSLTMHNGTWE